MYMFIYVIYVQMFTCFNDNASAGVVESVLSFAVWPQFLAAAPCHAFLAKSMGRNCHGRVRQTGVY